MTPTPYPVVEGTETTYQLEATDYPEASDEAFDQHLLDVLCRVADARHRQHQNRSGGWVHEDRHHPRDWGALILKKMAARGDCTGMPIASPTLSLRIGILDPDTLVDIAALAVAAIQARERRVVYQQKENVDV